MKRLHGEASAVVGASAGECLALFVAVDQYPAWYPQVVREAQVLAAAGVGLPTRAQVTLHVSRGPLQRDFRLLMDVSVTPPGSVALRRIPHDPTDEETFEVSWEIEELGECRRVRLAVEASLDVPRFLPLGTIGDELAGGFLSAAAGRLGPAS